MRPPPCEAAAAAPPVAGAAQAATVPALRGTTVGLMAAVAGLGAANLYYNQPLLTPIRETFGVSETAVGWVPTLTQVGYAVGMVFLVPLGDMFERRRLTVQTLLLTSLALAGAALAPTLPWLCACSWVAGVATIAPQLVLPMAAELASPGRRGRVIGQVMSGLLMGILLARSASGLLGSHLGWRAVFAVAAATMLASAGLVRLGLPTSRPRFEGSYTALLASVVRLLRAEPVLRECCWVGALGFGALNGFWATLAFVLAAPPFGLGPQAVGTFGLVGAASALAASGAGRLADRVRPRRTILASLALMALAWAVMGSGPPTLTLLGLGVVLVDVGLQGVHISNQARVYALRPDARSRVNTAYMAACFAGAAAGSALGGAAYGRGGWAWVCGLNVAALTLGALALAARRPPVAAG